MAYIGKGRYMFDRMNFMLYVGEKSGSNYASGLKRIEEIYNVDIDNEFGIDKCNNLLNKIKQDKTNQSLNKTELKSRSDMFSHLNRYIQFKSESNKGTEDLSDIELNTILYGPPGTGKTYYTVIYAVAIIEKKMLAEVEKEKYEDVLSRYQKYREQKRIEFTTFHQSYGYEEFIEGIKPVVDVDDTDDGHSDIQYNVQPGIFKKFCEEAQQQYSLKERYGFNENSTIWKVSLFGTGENDIRKDCMDNAHIRIGWDNYGENIDFQSADRIEGKDVLNRFIYQMQIGDIVFSCYSAREIDAIGVVVGEYEWHDEYYDYKRVRKVKWLVKNIKEDIVSINGNKIMVQASVYRLGNINLNDVYQILEKYNDKKETKELNENYVFIIDEINRGNISKVFGELITLLEPSKRLGNTECLKVMMPYSKKPFAIPKNIYLIGTMNTADHSIAVIDTALRRRFFFQEMLPKPELLDDVTVEDIDICKLLSNMNKKISILYDREHTIGHAYFIALKYNPSIDILAKIFKNNILPLLQEYFYDDYEKIRLVLGDNKKSAQNEQFIVVENINYTKLFGSLDIDMEDNYSYIINNDAFNKIESYRSI